MKLVAHNGGRSWGGNEKWLALLCRGLLDRGHDVVVSTTDGRVRRELERRGIPTTTIAPRGDVDVPRAWRFHRFLRRERPDAVLLTTWSRTFWGGWAARRAGVPRIVVRNGIDRAPAPGGKYGIAFRRWVDAVIVNAAAIKATWHCEAPWFPQDAVHVLLNGIEPPQPGARATRASLGLPDGARLVAGAGHLARRKGFDLLLDALARSGDPDARVVIVGSGEEEGALRAQAEALGIGGRVHWLGRREDVPEILAACDVFVLSSRQEGMANVMLEAMAVGALVVATDVSGVREAVGERAGRAPAGWIVPPDDADHLAAALRAALRVICEAPEDAARLRAEARWRVENWFGVGRMVEEAERILFPAR